HRREVVRLAALDGPDLERPVLALLRAPVLEDDARRNRAGPAEVADVEALDAAGRAREPEVALEAEHRAGHALGLARLARADPLAEQQPRVGLDHVHQVHLLATLRDVDRDAAPALAAQ